MFNSIIFNLGARTSIRGRSSGAYRIATELRSQGWDIEVVDFFYYWSLEELKQLSISRINDGTKFIGFSHIFTEWPQLAEDFCCWLKDTYPEIVILFGSNTYQNLNSKYIDYYLSGYGELGLVKFLSWKFGNGERPIITPIDNNKVLQCLQYYTAAPWKNPIIIYEDRDFILPYEWLGIEFSRGCKFKCAYCNFPMLGVKGDWTRDADNFEQQLKDAYDRFGTTRYIVSDETFNDRSEKISKFADAVESTGIDVFFNAHIRGDLLVSRPQDKEELLRMGVRSHFYGLESFNYESAKVCGKGMQSEKLKQGMLDIKDYFTKHGNKRYRGTIALIAGLPYESEESIIESYNWLIENWSTQSVMINPLDIYRSTAVGTKSVFEENFEKFGYREMSNTNGWDISKLARGPQFVKDVLIWENDHTNYFRIRQIVTDLQKNPDQNFYRIAFNLAADLSGKGLDHSLSIKDNDCDEEEHRIFASQYIKKKLNHGS